MPQAIDMIRGEHRSMTTLLDLLDHQIDLFEQAVQPDYDLIKEIVDYFLTFPDLYHHPKEDIIFRRIKKRAPNRAEHLFDLEAEHDMVSERLRVFTKAVINVMLEVEMPRDAFVSLAREFIEGERKHMAEEENHFLQLALDTLTDEDWQQIDDKFKRFADPLGSTPSMQFSVIGSYVKM